MNLIKNYPNDALHIYSENEPAMERNVAVLSDLPGEFYKIKADDKIPVNCKYSLATVQST